MQRERPDIVALQESNQTADASPAGQELSQGRAQTADGGVVLKCDNHAAALARLLRQSGVPCSWAWLPVKTGYERYDEGLAILSLCGSIVQTRALQLSRCADFGNWKTRKALGVRIAGRDDWFWTTHMGWWSDGEEPFAHQWRALTEGVRQARAAGTVWLMGDFNAPAEVRGEGYDLIRADGWHDAWPAEREGATIGGAIDGWRGNAGRGLRIDHIWCSRPVRTLSARVVLNGKDEPQVSDHFGVLLETKGVSI